MPPFKPYAEGMGHRIEYFSKGKIIGAMVSDAPLEDAQKIATDGFLRFGADYVRLIDIDDRHAEVWSKTREIT